MDGLSINKEQMEQLMDITGFNDQECNQLLIRTGWEVNEAINNLNSFISGSVGAVYSKEVIANSIKNAGLYEKLANNLSNLNTMRGGTKGFKGFVFEQLHATDATIKGVPTTAINNNGIADFAIKNADGSITYAQAKIGYNSSPIDFSAYKGQTIVVDKGNTSLINKAKDAGLNVVESDVSIKESANLAKKMQIESRITGKPNSVIVPKADAAIRIAKETNKAGLSSAAKGAQFGGGFSIGTNLVDVINGDKDIDEAALDVAKDTAISAGVGYVTGAAATVVGNTVVGAAVGSAITAAGATIGGTVAATGAAVASTAVGGAVVAAGTAVAGAATGVAVAAGTAVASTAAAAGTAVAGTVVGGAVAAAGTAIAGTAVGGAAVAAGVAVAGAAVVAAPVVAVGAALGVGYKVFKKIFK